jgi:hypothetical protein
MYPICNHFVPSVEYFPSGIPDQDLRTYSDVLSAGKLLATNAKLAAKALKKRKLGEFDPIVHENSCQIRALFAILHIDQVAEEATQMEGVWRRGQKRQYVS